MTRLLLALLLTLPAYPAFAQLSEKDWALVNECEANIDSGKKTLSPEAADKCVKGLNDVSVSTPSLINRYYNEQYPNYVDAAPRLIGYNNALLDLKRIVVKQSGYHGAKALARVLEKPDCALCDMTLGPKPEVTFDWVGKYASDRLVEVQRGVRTWDALANIRTTSLSSADYGMNKTSWNDQPIMSRYSELSSWARKETDKLEAAASLRGVSSKIDVAGLASVLREDLIFSDDAPYRAKLDALVGKAKEEAATKKPEAPSAADKKTKEMAAAGDRLAALTPDGRADFLNNACDKTAAAKPGTLPAGKPGTGAAKPGTVTPKTPIAAVKMTADEETALGKAMISMKDGKPVGYLADVMAQTEAGKRTLAFYQDPKHAKAGSNKLDYAFTREPGVFGYWDPDAKVIRSNSEVAEEFAAKRGMTVAQLLKDKAAMKELAIYISPTMIHEPKHQDQTARAIATGTDYKKFSAGSSSPYTRAMENQANKESCEHIIEYCSKNGKAACYAKFHPMHVDNAEKFMAGGVEALDTLKAPLYPRIDSFEGGAAREFKMVQGYAEKLKTLETMQRTNPAAMTPEQKLDLKNYKELMDTRFKWYTINYRDNIADELESLAFRKKYGSSSGLPGSTL